MTKEELFNIKIEKLNESLMNKIQANWDSVAKPLDGLGDFEKITARIGAITENEHIDISKKALVIMCADNGVVSEGVSQTDSSVTKSVAELMGKRESSVGIMTSAYGDITTKVIDIGIDASAKDIEYSDIFINAKVSLGTKSILVDNAMTSEECLKAIETGINTVRELKEKGITLIATGEMGIGNTTTSTALLIALTGCDINEVTGRGAGLSDEGLKLKKAVIGASLRFHDLLDVNKDVVTNDYAFNALCAVGGLDIAGLVGVYIGGALYRVPIVIDGVISAIAALTAELIINGTKEYMIPSHSGRENGTQKVLDVLNLMPVIKGDMALGEGTGAVMLFPLLDMVLALYNKGVQFDNTDIVKYERFK